VIIGRALDRFSGATRQGKIIENIVGGISLEFEMLMAPVLAPMILK
jgi:hypothetical protein